MRKGFVPIIMGSNKDYDFAKGIGSKLGEFDVPYEYRVCSAEKHPEYLIKMVAEYDAKHDLIVYETVAGRSNKLSGVVSGLTLNPVIACPPVDKATIPIDVWSTLRSPSDSPVMAVLDPENAALAALKIFALGDSDLWQELERYFKNVKEKIEKDDADVRGLHDS